MNIQLIVLGILLFIFAIIDFKVKEIPSILLTGTLFVICALNLGNIPFGVLSFIFAYLLYEADFIGGVADIKIIVTIGLLINSIYVLAFYIIIVLIYGIGWKIIYKWMFNKEKECPFIPCLFFVYVVLTVINLL